MKAEYRRAFKDDVAWSSACARSENMRSNWRSALLLCVIPTPSEALASTRQQSFHGLFGLSCQFSHLTNTFFVAITPKQGQAIGFRQEYKRPLNTLLLGGDIQLQ